MKSLIAFCLAVSLVTSCKDDDEQTPLGTLVVAVSGYRLESNEAFAILSEDSQADLVILGRSADEAQAANIRLVGNRSAIVTGTYSATEGKDCVREAGSEALCAVLTFDDFGPNGVILSLTGATTGGLSTLTITEADIRIGGIIRGEITGAVVNPATQESFAVSECRFAAVIRER